MGERRRDVWVGVGLFLLVVVVFSPALGNGYVWDDDAHVTGNAALRSWAGLWRIWFRPGMEGGTPQYYPVAFTIFWVEYQVWGLWAAGYHAVNVIVHGCSVVLLWRVLRRIGLEERVAIVAAALWGVHPVQVETVDWVMETKNVSSTFFYLLSARLLLRAWGFFGKGERQERKDERRGWDYAMGAGWFLLALLAKSVTATLPAAVLVVVWWRRGLRWVDVKRMLPLLVMGAVAGWFTAHVEATTVGAAGKTWELTAAQRVLIAGRVAVFYAAKLLWPAKLEFFYPRWVVDPGEWWQWLYPVGVAAGIGVLAAVAVRWTRARGALAGILFFGGTLVPALGFVNVYPFRYSFVADHFQYVACAGVLTLLAWGIVKIGRRQAWGMAAIVVAALGTRSFVRCFVYRDVYTLYLDEVRQEPGNWVGNALLGSVFAHWSETETGAHHADAAAELATQAEGLFGAATQEAPQVPEAWRGLAAAKGLQGRPAEAETILRQMLTWNGLPELERSKVYFDLGGLAERRGDPAAAEALFTQAIAANPRAPYGARMERGKLLANEGKYAEAAADFAEASRLVPEDAPAHLMLGQCLAQLRRLPEAEGEFEKAVEFDPQSADARALLERVRGMQGR